jgi:hypothetical protein
MHIVLVSILSIAKEKSIIINIPRAAPNPLDASIPIKKKKTPGSVCLVCANEIYTGGEISF